MSTLLEKERRSFLSPVEGGGLQLMEGLKKGGLRIRLALWKNPSAMVP